jgi:hypothetical protein
MAPAVVLREWYVKRAYWGKSVVVVEGVREDGQHWHSSVIVRRCSARAVRTSSGSEYHLSGLYNYLAPEGSLSGKAAEAFRDGFPEAWEQIVVAALHDEGKENEALEDKRRAPAFAVLRPGEAGKAIAAPAPLSALVAAPAPAQAAVPIHTSASIQTRVISAQEFLLVDTSKERQTKYLGVVMNRSSSSYTARGEWQGSVFELSGFRKVREAATARANQLAALEGREYPVREVARVEPGVWENLEDGRFVARIDAREPGEWIGDYATLKSAVHAAQRRREQYAQGKVPGGVRARAALLTGRGRGNWGARSKQPRRGEDSTEVEETLEEALVLPAIQPRTYKQAGPDPLAEDEEEDAVPAEQDGELRKSKRLRWRAPINYSEADLDAEAKDVLAGFVANDAPLEPDHVDRAPVPVRGDRRGLPWDADELRSLRRAHATVTAPTERFWDAVATRVGGGRGAQECYNQWCVLFVPGENVVERRKEARKAQLEREEAAKAAEREAEQKLAAARFHGKLAGRNTAKYRKQVRGMFEASEARTQGDLFESTPFKAKKGRLGDFAFDTDLPTPPVQGRASLAGREQDNADEDGEAEGEEHEDGVDRDKVDFYIAGMLNKRRKLAKTLAPQAKPQPLSRHLDTTAVTDDSVRGKFTPGGSVRIELDQKARTYDWSEEEEEEED